jgi:hypothetical protein
VKGRRIRELTSVVQKRFKFPEGSVELYAEKVRSGVEQLRRRGRPAAGGRGQRGRGSLAGGRRPLPG